MLTSGSAVYPNAEYIAEDGSTVVTVYAKTFQNLNNDEHTVAAEFMIPDPAGGPDIQKVAAQKFRLELTDPPKEEPPKEDTPPAVNEPEEPKQEEPPPENTPAAFPISKQARITRPMSRGRRRTDLFRVRAPAASRRTRT